MIPCNCIDGISECYYPMCVSPSDASPQVEAAIHNEELIRQVRESKADIEAGVTPTPFDPSPTRYLKQVIVVRKDLNMPKGKLAAMVAHAAMSFILKRLTPCEDDDGCGMMFADFTPEEERWFTELDPGLEEWHQVSMAKIVCEVADVNELIAINNEAVKAGFKPEQVFDSGHSHNKAGTFVAIAIGPAWPEQLEPVTGHLKVYR